MKKLEKIIVIILSWGAGGAIVVCGILALIAKYTPTTEGNSFISKVDIQDMFIVIIPLFLVVFANFSFATLRKFQETNAKIDDLHKHALDEIKYLKKISENDTEITADDFFTHRKDKDENFESIVKSNPKSIKFSGGNMHKLIDDMLSKDNNIVTDYIKSSNVKVQFLLPDPNNEGVIENLARNITTHKDEKEYQTKLKNTIKDLCNFIKDNRLSNRVKYRFYEFVPSFGLQIIAEGDDDRLYVDLFTIGIQKSDRYQFKIEKGNSPTTYSVFYEQYEKLWGISKQRMSDEKGKLPFFKRFIIAVRLICNSKSSIPKI